MPFMHLKCSVVSRSNDHYDNFSCHRCISQAHSANDTFANKHPTLVTITLPELHPHPSTAPHSQNSGEPSTRKPVTTQDPWSNPCLEFIETTREINTESVHCKSAFMFLSKNKIDYVFIETLNRTLNSLIENDEINFAMHAARISPH